MRVSWRMSSASWGPTVAARKRASESRCWSSVSWKGGSAIYCQVNGPAPGSVRPLLAEQVVDGVGPGDVVHHDVPALDRRREENLRLPRPTGEQVGEERCEARTVHVRPDRLRRLPRDERPPQEGGRPVQWRCHLVAHGSEHLLLALRTGPVVLVGRAAVLAYARKVECLLSRQVVLTG